MGYNSIIDAECDRKCHPEGIFAIDKIFIHPNYINTSTENDIALIQLKKPIVKYTYTIRPICLPLTKYKKNINVTDSSIHFGGWGVNDNGK